VNTFQINDLYKLLISYGKFIYHGVAIGKGTGNPSVLSLSLEDRADNAINTNLGLCCSTIGVGDSEQNLDYWGTFGIIIKPIANDSILLAHHADAGSDVDPNDDTKRIVTDCFLPPISLVELESTISKRVAKTANEWGVNNYFVWAVYLDPPYNSAAYFYAKNRWPHLKIITQDDNSFKEIISSNGSTCNFGNVVTPSDLYQ